MNVKAKRILFLSALVLLGSGALLGCRDAYPHSVVWQPGDLHRSHAEPAEGGYYTDWDPYAASLEVKPVSQINSVRTQHVLIATVRDKERKALPNRRVEWIIAEGSVGSIVEVDESGWRASRGHKEDNKFAITHTNNFAHTLTRGNDDPADDIHLEPGQTWCVITSPIEGTTHMVAYVPAIYDWDKHKVFVTKHWYDVVWELPPKATNRVGTPHVLTTKVMRHSDATPLEGYQVNYKILSGPAAVLQPGDGQTASVMTDANGLASVELTQQRPMEGTNEIEVHIVRPGHEARGKPAASMCTGMTKKHWLAPGIAIEKTAPPRAIAGEEFRYTVTVGNPKKIAANNVVVTDELPDGIEYVSSTPAASVSGRSLSWGFGSLEPGGTLTIHVVVKGTRTGTFENCATVKADDDLAGRSCAVTVISKPELALTKEGPAEVLLCDTITYNLRVTNTGDAPASNVRIDDRLPEGMQTTDGRSEAAFVVESLPAGEARAATVTARASRTGSFTNRAVATADGGLTAEAVAKTVVRRPVLEVSKTGPAERFLQRPAEFTITVRNTGDGEARNVVLTDTLDPSVEFISASDGGRIEGRQVSWALGTIPVDGSRRVSIRLRATTVSTITNRVTAKGDCCEASAEATMAIKGIPAILLECVDVEDPIEVGTKESYLITVTNQGSAEGTNIVITCQLPPEEEFVSADGPTEHTLDQKTVTFAPLPSLAPKAKATYRVIIRGIEAGDVRFKVTLTSDQMATPVAETESTNIYR